MNQLYKLFKDLAIKQKDDQIQKLRKRNIQLQQKNKELHKMYLIQESKRKIFQSNYNPNLYVRLSVVQNISKYVSDKILKKTIGKPKLPIQNIFLIGYAFYILLISIILTINYTSVKIIQYNDIVLVPIALFVQYLFLQEVCFKYPVQQKYIVYAFLLKVLSIIFFQNWFNNQKIFLFPFLLEIQVFVLSLSQKLKKQRPELKKIIVKVLVSIIILTVFIKIYQFYQSLILKNEQSALQFTFIILIILISINYKIESYLKKLKIWKSNIKLAQIFISFAFLFIIQSNQHKLKYLWTKQQDSFPFMFGAIIFTTIYICTFWSLQYLLSK